MAQFSVQLDFPSENFNAATKDKIRKHIYNLQQHTANRVFHIQRFTTKNDADMIRSVVETKLGELAPEILPPVEGVVEGANITFGSMNVEAINYWYLVIVAPTSCKKLDDLELFEKYQDMPIFVSSGYQDCIMDIITAVSLLMKTPVRCRLKREKIVMYSEDDLFAAKFVAFDLQDDENCEDKDDVCSNLKNLFNDINVNSDISGSLSREFAAFFDFLEGKSFNMENLGNVRNNVIFWSKEKRRNFMTYLCDYITCLDCTTSQYENIFSKETEDAFGYNRDWKARFLNHPEMCKVHKALEDSYVAENFSYSGLRGVHEHGYESDDLMMKRCLIRIRDLYEHRLQLKLLYLHNIQLNNIDLYTDADLVGIIHFLFPLHIDSFARAIRAMNWQTWMMPFEIP
ncbi:hypothetical protein HS088_TW07G01100 [Tripterygium wilfordii]|uniref:Uncharacterized protein n=1 Tax=Tripterygium wilfordii TaxID=458696 RepID=A0A7J7DGK7_TRIWF|nr:uncharacterized protein LOC120001505 [Tripterygium wilfordii]XP_038706709.1 uncharacterized protein LOC120002170 [Tripterygium wilfordii]KAF5745510.1 hypothetical protein HS088_TW07G01100 [Tripterygium wilfordii]